MNTGVQSSRDLDQVDEIYLSLVLSLYRDPKTLIVGSIGTIGACLITAIKTVDPAFAACTAALTVISILRAWDMRRFATFTVADMTPARAVRLERRYALGSSVYVLLMGIWCFLAFARSHDPVVQLLSFSMTLVNMIGVAGRNYGSRLLVSAQLICAGLPIFLGLFWIGDVYYSIIGCVILPFFISFKTIADRLRGTLSGAVLDAKRVRLLADRLDTALNNMAHGLCMMDPQGAIVLANERLPEVIGVDLSVFRVNRSARRALMECAYQGVVARQEVSRLLGALRSRDRFASRSLSLPLRDGRLLMLTFRGMPDGGSVMLAEDVTEQRNAAARISHLAHHDSLTGLPNRTQFRERVRELLTTDGPDASCAILFIDLDEFKQVNDTLGHPCGDELLKVVAARLQARTGKEHLIARLGGDEFVLFMRPLAEPIQAADMAHKIVQTLSQPYEIQGHSVIVGASIGIALSPADGSDPDELLKNADMALYSAKSGGRGQWRFFEPEMDLRVKRRRLLELDLRHALRTGGLDLHFQPMVDRRTGSVVACEALLRWLHPERGQVPPAEFVPMAEEMGLIVDMGRWVLETACREAASWPGETRVAVNLSPIQFRHRGLLESVQAALGSAGLPPSRLELEITETALLSDTASVLAVLGELRSLGVLIALDDFGTGYSSLSYLRNFPLDIVKIDRSFLIGIETESAKRILLGGVSRLCRDLGLSVTIEGVETTEQLRVVEAIPEIQVAQGYLFQRPCPADEVRQLLEFGLAATAAQKTVSAPARSGSRAG